MQEVFWWLLLLQMAMGAFDTLFHHEMTLRLAWQPASSGEVKLHGVRNLMYALAFGTIGVLQPQGVYAWALIALVVAELGVTAWDFVEEDRTRKLPATERVTHLALTFNYGVLLALLVPQLLRWAALPSDLVWRYYGIWSWLCGIASIGVVLSGLRDMAAARRAPRLVPRDARELAMALGGERKAVLVTGGTGFVGSRLVEALVAAGYEVTVLTRRREHAAALPAPFRVITSLRQIGPKTRIDAIVNLAGEPISDSPWTRGKRMRILRSRLRITRDLVALMGRLERKPEVLVNGSAIGWYGLRGDEELTEADGGRACFSRQLCVRWEREAQTASRLGVRVVYLRTGLVLAAQGGMLSRLLVPFEFGLGGPFSNGQHWMSWIHRDDLVRMIVHAMARGDVRGPLNATAPVPVRNREFTAALGHALHRPAWLPVPGMPLRLILGAFAEELLLSGQRVLPAAAQASGFRFDYPTMEEALDAIVGNRRASVTPKQAVAAQPGGAPASATR